MIPTPRDKYDIIEQHALSRSVARIFEEAEKRYPLLEFSHSFINTELFRDYFSDYTVFSQSRKYVLGLYEEEFAKNSVSVPRVEGTQYDGDVAYWMGYLLAEWAQEYNLNMSTVSPEHLEWLYNNFDVLHTQSVRYVYREYVCDVLGIQQEPYQDEQDSR